MSGHWGSVKSRSPAEKYRDGRMQPVAFNLTLWQLPESSFLAYFISVSDIYFQLCVLNELLSKPVLPNLILAFRRLNLIFYTWSPRPLPEGNAHGHSESEILTLLLLGCLLILFFFSLFFFFLSEVAHCLKCSLHMNQSLGDKDVKAQGQY